MKVRQHMSRLLEACAYQTAHKWPGKFMGPAEVRTGPPNLTVFGGVLVAGAAVRAAWRAYGGED